LTFCMRVAEKRTLARRLESGPDPDRTHSEGEAVVGAGKPYIYFFRASG